MLHILSRFRSKCHHLDGSTGTSHDEMHDVFVQLLTSQFQEQKRLAAMDEKSRVGGGRFMHTGRRMKPSSGVFRIIGAPTASRDDYYSVHPT